ncbi:SDR family NAD(P)-dependent oxidoreductase [Priestia megaterium]|uniref:glucose 1-dehydrogenase [NAD(P)(+)] n=1 Tax=Priestia megaterium (strain DSM 319 / IMG 1521) TaxID=592022 RepID=D5DIJ3_PRIM3|nr:SDR family oxidoreductase [Priestia megaterium]ADF40294.1 3-ketoacyl-acyl carrier protein reductase [Priestia megaterium DSM 319]MED4216364.1 SDR family NAD(P)-dependent oxidoreductase [Priestia megaterium]WEZ39402.1 SDR family NAD(P)-dependent oxidoreductase [Priestia megaterium DSM 319]
MIDFKNKVFIITGGGTGIGKATALKLADRGAKLVINYSNSETEAKKVVEEIIEKGGTAFAFKANVASEHEVNNMIDRTITQFGRLDGLVNNASITAQISMNDLESATDDVWDSLYDVNVKGMFHCVKAAVPHIKKQKAGAIVNVGSIAGTTGIGSSIPYAATKAAIHTMTKSLAIALAPHIRVNCISPGAVDTRWWSGNEDKMYQLAGNLPLQRISSPEDIADAILFQLKQESLTGQVFTIDNGQTL